MSKTKWKYFTISLLLLSIALVLANCGGGGSSYVPDTTYPTSAPVPTYTGNVYGSISGYAYKDTEDDPVIMTGASRDELLANSEPGISQNDVQLWLAKLTPQYVNIQVGTEIDSVITSDQNGFFNISDIPVDNSFEPVGIGVEFADNSFFGFEDYLDYSALLKTSETGTLVSTPAKICQAAGTMDIFWVKSTTGASLQGMTFSTDSLGTVYGPFFVRKGGTTDYKKAYGFYKSGNTSGTSTITVSLSGYTALGIPVEIVKETAKIYGTVLRNGEAPDFGWVTSFGPWAFDFIGANGSYTLQKVYKGTSREVKASYWVWTGSKFEHYTDTQIISNFQQDTQLDFGGGTTNPTSTPTTTEPTATYTPTNTPTNTPTPTAQWEDWSANLPETADLRDVQVIGNNVWIAGGSDEVYYSSDGGNIITSQAIPAVSTAALTQSVFIKSDFQGYTVTNTGRILYSANAQNGNWTNIGSPGGALYSVSFPSSGTGYACGSSGRIYSITGTTVALDYTVTGATLYSITSPASGEGWVCGEAVIRYKTGAIWELPNYDNGYSYNSIYFKDSSKGWAVGAEGIIARTTNGADWAVQITTTNQLNDVFFLTTTEGWAVGQNVILHTTNGGTTWTEEASSLTSGKYLRGVYFTDSNNGYVVGNGGTLLRFH